MKRILRENKVLYSYSDDTIPESLFQCFPKMHHAGSVAETVENITNSDETNYNSLQ